MSPTIVHLSGPQGSGKTSVARILAARGVIDSPHLLRMELNGGVAQPILRVEHEEEGLDRVDRCVVSEELVYEQVPEELARAAYESPGSTLIVETDGQSCFRHAYPYDVQVFMMAPPRSVVEVFRTAVDAAAAIERAMHDTNEFAAEVFGLPRERPIEAVAQTFGRLFPVRRPQPSFETVDAFLASDLGAEIAARMQLQPGYHGLVESDVTLINEGVGDWSDAALACAERIAGMLGRLRRQLGRETWFGRCDPWDDRDPETQACLERIEQLVCGARAELR